MASGLEDNSIASMVDKSYSQLERQLNSETIKINPRDVGIGSYVGDSEVDDGGDGHQQFKLMNMLKGKRSQNHAAEAIEEDEDEGRGTFGGH